MKKYPLNTVDYYERFRDMIDGMAEKYGEAFLRVICHYSD